MVNIYYNYSQLFTVFRGICCFNQENTSEGLLLPSKPKPLNISEYYVKYLSPQESRIQAYYLPMRLSKYTHAESLPSVSCLKKRRRTSPAICSHSHDDLPAQMQVSKSPQTKPSEVKNQNEFFLPFFLFLSGHRQRKVKHLIPARSTGAGLSQRPGLKQACDCKLQRNRSGSRPGTVRIPGMSQ